MTRQAPEAKGPADPSDTMPSVTSRKEKLSQHVHAVSHIEVSLEWRSRTMLAIGKHAEQNEFSPSPVGNVNVISMQSFYNHTGKQFPKMG